MGLAVRKYKIAFFFRQHTFVTKFILSVSLHRKVVSYLWDSSFAKHLKMFVGTTLVDDETMKSNKVLIY